MTGDPLEIFQPGLEHWNLEKERQRHATHECFIDAPPWDAQLDAGAIRLTVPSEVEDPASE
ncbi:MAG: hypothetical protein LBJ02_10600 [Bifidobacteriaceae bacterium]|jgi:hypothetical protein|nr:hypothetical protein [Bifidobacteriaceae bacterium]